MYYQNKKRNSTVPREWFFLNPEVGPKFVDVKKISNGTGIIFFNENLNINKFCRAIEPYIVLCQRKKIKFIIPCSIYWANKYKAFGLLVSLNKKLKSFYLKNKSNKKFFLVSKVHNIKEAYVAKDCVDLIFLSPVLKTTSYPEKKPLKNYIFISLCFFFKEKVIFGLGGVNYKNFKSIQNKYLYGFGAISFFKKKNG